MLRPERYGYLVPFPRIPDSMGAKYAHHDLSLRPFGHFENDLEVDFHQNVCPHLVTQILACCARDKNGDTPDQTFFWNLTIGKRIECLLTIATLGNSSDLSVRLPCLNEVCKEQMEIDISLESLFSLQQQQNDDNDHVMIQIGDERIPVRKPTGSDQIEWLKRSFTDKDEAVKAMIQTLMSKPASFNQEYPISDEWISTLDSTMEDYDPLVNFSLSVRCPFCEKQGNYELNLEALSLQKLHEAQLRLLDDVHRLALYYHWGEQQIFSIPPWRRSHYLALIKRDKER